MADEDWKPTLANLEYEALSVLSLRPGVPDAVSVRLMIQSKTGHKIRAADMVKILNGMIDKGLLRAKGSGKRRLYRIEVAGATAYQETLDWMGRMATKGYVKNNPNGPAPESTGDWPHGFRAEPE